MWRHTDDGALHVVLNMKQRDPDCEIPRSAKTMVQSDRSGAAGTARLIEPMHVVMVSGKVSPVERHNVGVLISQV
ncbi:MAG TPA: hypothetical protein VFV38_08550 [Ktedonobacteraceae bacterium]|nr:hypothetical protein [Ktedonobacteraceae bacterium]